MLRSKNSQDKSLENKVTRRKRNSVETENVNSNSANMASTSKQKLLREENSNLNVSSPKSKRLRKTSGSRLVKTANGPEKAKTKVKKRTQVSSTETNANEDECDEVTEVVQFEEDGQDIQVEMTAPTNEFLSDGELDSNAETQDSEVEDEADASVNQSQESAMETEHDRLVSENSSSSSSSTQTDSEDESKRWRKRKKRKQKRRKHRKSVENCLDMLSTTLQQLHTFMMLKGAFAQVGNDTSNTEQPQMPRKEGTNINLSRTPKNSETLHGSFSEFFGVLDKLIFVPSFLGICGCSVFEVSLPT